MVTQDAPKSMLTLHIEDSFLRMLAHALCQYYGLNSQSKDSAVGRVTLVTRRKKKFSAIPAVRLTDYLFEKAGAADFDMEV